MRIHRAARGGSRAAFSLVEVMISASVFLLVASAVVTTVVVSTALSSTNRESALAARAAQSVLEELKGVAFEEVFARYNDTTADDPAAGASPGSAFEVEGLSPRDGDADGIVGRLEFPGTGVELREDVVDVELGLPRDLSLDGLVDAADHAPDYQVLPVRAVVEWTGNNGTRTLELVTVLAGY